MLTASQASTLLPVISNVSMHSLSDEYVAQQWSSVGQSSFST
jgi:hypothetical protein